MSNPLKIYTALLICLCFSPHVTSGQVPLNQIDKAIKITTPPKILKLDRFYKKYACINGIHIVSSAKVPDAAIYAACKTIKFMTDSLPKDVRESLTSRGTRVGIMARYEGTTDIPEHAYLASDTTLNWDVRARGLGGTLELPLTTCAEENLLCYQIDKYHAEDILIHEFAHTIHGVGIMPVDTTFNEKLKEQMDTVINQGKYKDTYALTDIVEYFAEGVQTWFNVNAEVPVPDGKHNFLNTRLELKEYDPGLYQILKRYFPEIDECPSCHKASNKYTE
ncbi:hypothetical protein JW935_21405 [candidate division KSB1 bacterium]|nr:hypothetical protein [candidate division KSB1 bacterium]